MQQSTAAFFSSSNTSYASITQSGDIVASDMMGNRIVGVSIERYKQLEQMATEATATAEQYHKQLVDAGLITMPKTDAEKIDELSTKVAQLTQVLMQMQGIDNGHRSDGKSVPSGKQPVARKNQSGSTDSGAIPADESGSS